MVLPQAMAWVQYWFRVLSLKFCGKSKKICGDISQLSPAFCMYGHKVLYASKTRTSYWTSYLQTWKQQRVFMNHLKTLLTKFNSICKKGPVSAAQYTNPPGLEAETLWAFFRPEPHPSKHNSALSKIIRKQYCLFDCQSLNSLSRSHNRIDKCFSPSLEQSR